jgi:hypothetical protein
MGQCYPHIKINYKYITATVLEFRGEKTFLTIGTNLDKKLIMSYSNKHYKKVHQLKFKQNYQFKVIEYCNLYIIQDIAV